MEKRNLWLGLCATLMFCGTMTSCDDNDDPKFEDEGSKIELPSHRMFILNEGSVNSNNASMSLYSPADGSITGDIFYRQNDLMLGDVGQDMIEYDGCIYVSVYKSNYLVKLNAAGVEQQRLSFVDDPELQGGIRYLAAEDGYIYASFHGGVVAKINARNLKLEKKATGLGANLEGVAIEGDKLYVANSYSQSKDPDTGKNIYTYFNDIFAVSLRDLSLSSTITVASNPNEVIEEDDRIFVLSHDYNDESYVLQMIDPKDNKVTRIGYATFMTANDDTVYLVDSRTDWTTRITTNTFWTYDIKSGQAHKADFLSGAPEKLYSSSIYLMEVDEETDEIYIGTTDFTTAGTIYRFNRNGQYVSEFSSEGINPNKAVFFGK